MKRIPLTQGRVALVSDCDYKYLMQWKWHFHQVSKKDKTSGYAASHGRGALRGFVYMHKIIAKRMGLKGEIDHRNKKDTNNKLNNQRQNLREATHPQNISNREIQTHNTSGYQGVSHHKQKTKWRAYIVVDDKQKHLGLFPYTRLGKIKAAFAYNVAALKCVGKFAFQNPVNRLLDARAKRLIKQETLQQLRKYGL